MKYDDPREIAVDAAGLGAGGAVRAGLRFPAAVAATIAARSWVESLLGFSGGKSFLGLFPSPGIPGFPVGEAFDAALSLAGGALALVNQGINIGAGITGALSSGNILGAVLAIKKLPDFLKKSLAFVTEAGTTFAEVQKGFSEVGIGFVREVEGIARDLATTVQYYALLIGGIVAPFKAPIPRVFEKFVFRTPDEILLSLLGPVTDVGSRFVPGDVRPPTIGERRTFGAKEAVRQARERFLGSQAVPNRLTIERAREVGRIGVEFQQEQLQLSLGMVARSRGETDTGLLELLREVKGE